MLRRKIVSFQFRLHYYDTDVNLNVVGEIGTFENILSSIYDKSKHRF